MQKQAIHRFRLFKKSSRRCYKMIVYCDINVDNHKQKINYQIFQTSLNFGVQQTHDEQWGDNIQP